MTLSPPIRSTPIARTFFLALFFLSVTCFAQETPSVAKLNESYQKLAAQIGEGSEVSEQLSSIMSATQGLLEEVAQLTSNLAELNEISGQPAANEDSFNAELRRLESAYPSLDRSAGPTELKMRVGQFQAERESVINNLSALKAEAQQMTQRGETIANQIIEARKTGLGPTESVATPLERKSYLDQARALFAQVTNAKSRLKLRVLEKELTTLPLQQTQLDYQIRLETERLEMLTKAIAASQSQLRRADLLQARQLVKSIEQRLQNSSDQDAKNNNMENLALAEKLIDLTESYYAQQNAVQATENQNNEVEKSIRLLERIIAAGRADGELAAILHRVRANLVSPLDLRRQISRIQSRQIKLQLDEILWQDGLDEIRLIKEESPLILQPNTLLERQQILASLIETAAKVEANYNNHLQKLEALQNNVKSLQRDLDGRLLWLPTNQSLNSSWLTQTYDSLRAFLNPKNWALTLADFHRSASRTPLWWSVLYLVGFGLLFYRKRLIHELISLSQKVGNVNLDRHWVSPYAFLLCLAIASALPLILWTSGSLLASAEANFSRAISSALKVAAQVLLIFALLTLLGRPRSLIGGHFDWQDQPRKIVVANLQWLTWFIVPCTFVFAYATTIGDPQSQYGLGRTVFLLASLAIAVTGYRILEPGNHVSRRLFGHLRSNFLSRLVFVLFAIVPLLLGILTLIGYFDTAIILQENLVLTGLMILVAVLVYGFMRRTHEVSARQRAWERAKARRKARLEKLAEGSAQIQSGDNLPIYDEEGFADLEEINKETKTVIWLITIATLVTGIYLIWRSVLPALDVAESIVLWQGINVVDGVSTLQPITIGNLIVAIALTLGGFILAKNLRGILALGVSQKLKMRPGTEYAATTILGYIFIAIGVVLGLSQLGLDWAKLQWVVAAMGVGLGFGLQEIVANFVSGLIILFERPIRVGDVVTIGQLEGTVNRISIRATTITDFNKHDVLIPNKKIITDNVTNWTLHDSVTRLHFTIGVGYKSDIALVKQLMMEVITANPDVLQEPGPSVYLINHSESTLDFEVRAFVAEISKRLMTRHALQEAIHNTLTDAGINLAFPQRDIHIIRPPHTTP